MFVFHSRRPPPAEMSIGRRKSILPSSCGAPKDVPKSAPRPSGERASQHSRSVTQALINQQHSTSTPLDIANAISHQR